MKQMMWGIVFFSVSVVSVKSYAENNVKIGFLVVSTDTKLNQDTLSDLTEGVTFSITQSHAMFGTITKERVADVLKNARNPNHEVCYSDLLCVRQRASDLKKVISTKEPSLTAVELIIIELLVEENHIRVVGRFGSSDLSSQGVEIRSAYLVKREFRELSSVIQSVTEMILTLTHPKSVEVSTKKEIVEKEKIVVNPQVSHREKTSTQKEVIPEIKTDAVHSKMNSKKILFRVLAGVAGTVGISAAIVAGIAGKDLADAQDQLDRCTNEYCENFIGLARQNVVEVGRSKALAVNVLAPTAAVMTGLAIAFWFIGDRYDDVPVMSIAPTTDSGGGMQMWYSTSF